MCLLSPQIEMPHKGCMARLRVPYMRRMVRIIGIQRNRSCRKEDLGKRKWVEVRMGEERPKEGILGCGHGLTKGVSTGMCVMQLGKHLTRPFSFFPLQITFIEPYFFVIHIFSIAKQMKSGLYYND